MIKLVATDMDGTFLDEAGQFDMERLKALLSSYKQRGIYFAVNFHNSSDSLFMNRNPLLINTDRQCE